MIDTALAACTTAVVSEGRILSHASAEIGRGHAELWPHQLQSLVAAGMVPISHIAVCVGPGSFTGTRIGVAGARALGIAWGVPVSGASSLAALAHAATQQGLEACLVLHDAQRGMVYGQYFNGQNPVGDSRLLTRDEAVAWACAEEAPLCGSAVDMVVAGAPQLAARQRRDLVYPHPLSLAACATRSTQPLYADFKGDCR